MDQLKRTPFSGGDISHNFVLLQKKNPKQPKIIYFVFYRLKKYQMQSFQESDLFENYVLITNSETEVPN